MMVMKSTRRRKRRRGEGALAVTVKITNYYRTELARSLKQTVILFLIAYLTPDQESNIFQKSLHVTENYQ